MTGAIRSLQCIPYVQKHELEALVFADLGALKLIVDSGHFELSKLEKDVQSFAPEEINDRPETAPSKRLEGALRFYDKVLHGPLAIEGIGLPKLRAKCPRFHAWITRLEELK